MTARVDWSQRAEEGFLASGIDPADRRGHKNYYIDLLQKMALEEVLDLKGNEVVLDFGCGSGRIAYWIASRVKKVVGLEITPEMIDLAEKNRTVENVEFMVYDGIHFPVFPYPFDIILSVGVLQIMKVELLKNTLSRLAHYLKKDGRLYLIEQVSDNPKVRRPQIEEYLRAFKESKLECFQHYPIRNGRWWLLYLIRYGLIPEGWFRRIAVWELMKTRKTKKRISYYRDYLFLIKRP
jgi:SAM-dependent methyltransferase